MASAPAGAVVKHVQHLFTEGGIAGLGEAQLLERYTRARDETAFAALVALHGPLVLGVCRRWLRDPNDVDDAFQATFLVLARRAKAIRDGNRLGPWLYGVAFRVASRLRSQAVRRSQKEESTVLDVPAKEQPTMELSDLPPVLDEELARLPEHARATIVLCDLEGASCEEAALKLGCPVGTLKSRLSRARERLKDRLARRGFGPLAMAWESGRVSQWALAPPPLSLCEATVRAASEFCIQRGVAAGAVSASAAALARGVLKSMLVMKIKTTAAILGLSALACGSTGAFVHARQAGAGGRVPQSDAVSTGAADRLLGNQTPVPPVHTPTDPLIPSTPADMGSAKTAAIPAEELRIKLAAAKRKLAWSERQFKAHVLAQAEYDEAADAVQLIESQIEAQTNALSDEVELLEAQLKVRQAELEAAMIRGKDIEDELALAKSEVERGVAPQNTLARALSQQHACTATIQIQKANLLEWNVRLAQAKRRVQRMAAIPRPQKTAVEGAGAGARTPEAPAAAKP
jgi:RNA polymerase sigma factor (sigma-70 family)